jgi:hypothetical protein
MMMGPSPSTVNADREMTPIGIIGTLGLIQVFTSISGRRRPIGGDRSQPDSIKPTPTV